MSEHTAKKCSIVKMEANRRNAEKSTGPRTPEGKSKSRWNALKHGILAREVVFTGGDGAESQSEFDRLHLALRNDIQPETVMEEILVERMAQSYWRLGRAQRCEVGQIRLELRDARECSEHQPSTRDRESTAGIGYHLEVLGRVKRSLVQAGCISNVDLDVVDKAFGREHEITGLCCLFVKTTGVAMPKSASSQGNPAGGTPAAANSDDGTPDADTPVMSPESLRPFKTKVLSAIDHEEGLLKKSLGPVYAREELEREACSAAQSLPSRAADLILRYEAAVDKQLYRAKDELERSQRQRRGESLPPPLKIQVSSEK